MISPSGLGFVVLCFFFPFFTVSCSGMLGTLDIGYSGISLAFNGTPSVSGSLASELGPGDLEDLRAGVQPLLLVTLAVLLAGGVLSAVMPNPLVRGVCALSAAGLSLVLSVVNQIGLHGGVEREIRAEAGSDIQYADYSAGSGAGFWLLLVVLLGVIVYNVVDLVVLSRGPGRGAVNTGGMPPGGPFPPVSGPSRPGPGGPQGQYPPGGHPPQGQYPQGGYGPQGQYPPQGYRPQGHGQPGPGQWPRQDLPPGRPPGQRPAQPPPGQPGQERLPGYPDRPPGETG